MLLAHAAPVPEQEVSPLQVSTETTLFMQKAMCYVSKLIAARGILELTDRRLCFQVFQFDASFGIKNVSIELSTITAVGIEAGDMHPRVVVTSQGRRYEFVLPKGQELYDRLRDLVRNPLEGPVASGAFDACDACGKAVSGLYRFCPWCGGKLGSA